jgi:hypothetical protein
LTGLINRKREKKNKTTVLDSFSHHNTERAPQVYVYLITLVVIGLPLSRFVMSVSQILLLLFWLFWQSPDFKQTQNNKGFLKRLIFLWNLVKYNIQTRGKRFFSNKAALALASIYLMHLIGVLYSSNLHYAAKDLRIKLPLLIFPLVFSSLPKLSYRQFKFVLAVFIGSVSVGVVLGFFKYFSGNYIDVRELSPFLSPIRFSLNVLFSIIILIYFILYDETYSTLKKITFTIISLLFVFFILIIESITALGILAAFLFVLVLFHLSKIGSVRLKTAIVLVLIAIPVIFGFYVYKIVEEATTPPAIDFSKLEKTTALGNIYVHDTSMGIEDGKYVGLHLCRSELREAWNKRSKLDFNGKALNGDNLDNIIIRYLTSKGLKKDASGINSLSQWDIEKIEEGIANINYITHPGLKSRILKIILGYERYRQYGDPSGNSVMQRYEYLKGSVLLIKKHWLIGVGTGDLEDELFRQYKEMGSKLKKKYIFHPHNQFVTITIMFGITGLLWFIYSLIYPPYTKQYFTDYFFLSFFIMIILSMLSDDTLDTQAGATLFAFFYSFLLFARKEKNSLYISYVK